MNAYSYVPRCWKFLELQNLVQNSYNDYMGKGESKVASSWQYSLAPFEQRNIKTTTSAKIRRFRSPSFGHMDL